MLRISLSLVMFLLLGCDDSLIQNSRVQRWCEDRPCGWDAEGELERVGSWHQDDYAVSFVSDDARISQFNGEAESRLVHCLAFTMVAKIDPGVRMFLELDFLDDGAIEFQQRLPESDFDQLRFLITPPKWYEGVRFILRKNGPGRAVLAELSAETSGDCTAPPVALLARPDGIECESDEDCANGRCTYDHRCGGCFDDAYCIDGKVCGFEPVRTAYVTICVEPAKDEFGDRCLDDAECASGVCCNGACSECCTDAACGASKCARPAAFPEQSDDGEPLYWPWLCSPGSRSRASGELCASDADCESLLCNTASGMLRGCELACAPDTTWLCQACETTRVYGGTCQ